MITIAHFAQFFAFALGLVAIYIVISLKRKTRNKPLDTYFLVIVSINFIILVHVFQAFSQIASSEELYIKKFQPIFLYSMLPLAGLRLYIANRFIHFSFQLYKKSASKYFDFLTIGVFILFLVYSLWLDYSVKGMVAINSYVITGIHFLLFLGLSLGSIFIHIQKKTSDFLRENWIRNLTFFWIGYATSMFLFRLANFPTKKLDDDFQMLGISLLSLLFNLFHVVYLKKIFVSQSEQNNLVSIQEMFKEYEITKREQEIIELICQGKTNKETAELLFITPVTVRDHLSNIYRKTKVKNRTQLASMFRL